MNELIRIQQQLLPDLLKVMRKRYEILRHIKLMQPVGRRSLSSVLSITERTLRSEVDFLRNQGLIQVTSIGMSLTDQGSQLLVSMEPVIKEAFGLVKLENDLKNVLNIKEVIIVPGNSDETEWVKREIGRAGVQMLKKVATPNQVVAVAGGTTVLAVAEMMTPSAEFRTTTFVPTRGGLAEDQVELESNYIVSLLAKNSGGRYRVMYIPEQLSDESYQSMIREPHIQSVLNVLRRARVVLHGIGDAKRMAIRRNSPPEVISRLEKVQAVGESLGYYYNAQRDVVGRVKTVGLTQEDIQQVELMIAVAGGASKAKAIRAICSHSDKQILITDEAAATAILQEESQMTI